MIENSVLPTQVTPAMVRRLASLIRQLIAITDHIRILTAPPDTPIRAHITTSLTASILTVLSESHQFVIPRFDTKVMKLFPNCIKRLLEFEM